MFPTPAHIQTHTEKIIGCAIEVHKTFGAGLLESVYRECMAVEFKNAGLQFESERCIKLSYKGVPINTNLFVDLLVEGIIVVELKAVDALHPIYSSQVITYLKLANCPAGLLLNFNVTRMKAGVKRLDHPELYRQKKPEISS
jgi:GxxExxY protein